MKQVVLKSAQDVYTNMKILSSILPLMFFIRLSSLKHKSRIFKASKCVSSPMRAHSYSLKPENTENTLELRNVVLLQTCFNKHFENESDSFETLSVKAFLCVFSVSGLRLAEQLGRREDEAKIRHRLGLSLWASGNLEESQHQVPASGPTLAHKHTLSVSVVHSPHRCTRCS